MYTCFLAVFKPYGVPPLAFATAPKGGSNPLEHLPVGADLLSCKKQAVNGGKKIFFATFLQAKKQAIDSLLCAWFLQITDGAFAQRSCCRHASDKGC